MPRPDPDARDRQILELRVDPARDVGLNPMTLIVLGGRGDGAN